MLTTGRKMTKAYLDTTMMSPESMEFEAGLHQRIVGQEEAVSQLVQTYEIYTADNGFGSSHCQSPIPGSHWHGKNADRGSCRRNSLRQFTSIRQNRLRRIPA